MAKKGRKPDFRLKVFDKDTEESGEVGAGWLNDDGSISVRLNHWVVLDQRQLRGSILTLFPEGTEPPRRTVLSKDESAEPFKPKKRTGGDFDDITNV